MRTGRAFLRGSGSGSWFMRRRRAGRGAVLVAALRFGLHDGYWGAISAIIVLQSNMGATGNRIARSLDWNADRGVFGFAFSVYGVLPWNYALAVLAAIIVWRPAGTAQQFAAGRSNDYHHHAGAKGRLALGVGAGPRGPGDPGHCGRARRDYAGFARSRAAAAARRPGAGVLVLGAFFEAIMQGFRGAPAENLAALRDDALAMLRGNNQLLEAARSEPSGGPGLARGIGNAFAVWPVVIRRAGGA